MNNEMCGCNGTCGTEEKTSTAKGLVRINYKEDFELVVELLAGDKPYKLGDEDFRIDFIVMASHYTVGRTAGVCERCSVDGNKIRCFIDSHGLPPGELRAEVKVNNPDPNYAGGSRLNVAMAEGVVVLVKDNTRFDGAVVKANIPVALVDAYQLAKAHGYKGTIDEYYATFNDVSALLESMRGVAEEERKRITSEEARNKAEQQRQDNEDARQRADKDRTTAESNRASAEEQRVKAEKQRSGTEDERNTAEEKRAKDELARVDSESERAKAEEGRTQAEKQRQTAEEERVNREKTIHEVLNGRDATTTLDLMHTLHTGEFLDTRQTYVKSKQDTAMLSSVIEVKAGDVINVEVESTDAFSNYSRIVALTNASGSDWSDGVNGSIGKKSYSYTVVSDGYVYVTYRYSITSATLSRKTKEEGLLDKVLFMERKLSEDVAAERIAFDDTKLHIGSSDVQNAIERIGKEIVGSTDMQVIDLSDKKIMGAYLDSRVSVNNVNKKDGAFYTKPIRVFEGDVIDVELTGTDGYTRLTQIVASTDAKFSSKGTLLEGKNNIKNYTYTVVSDGYVMLSGSLDASALTLTRKVKTAGFKEKFHEFINNNSSQSRSMGVALGSVSCEGFNTSGYSHIILYGQSLSCGDITYAPITGKLTPTRDDVLMVSSRDVTDTDKAYAALTPMKSAAGTDWNTEENDPSMRGESPIAGACYALKALLDKTPYRNTKIIGTACGTGSTSIGNLSAPGTWWYKRFTDCVDMARDLTQGESINCPAIVWMQGEKDNKNGAYAGKEGYKKSLRTLKDMMQTYIMQKYGQKRKPLFFLYQSNWMSGYPIESQAAYELALESEDFILMNPHYQVPHTSGHLTSNGSRWYGEYIAKSVYSALCKDVRIGTVYPMQFKLNEEKTSLQITFNVPNPPLVIDTTMIAEQENYGFGLYKDGVSVDIYDVKITSPNEVTLYFKALGNDYLKLEVEYAGIRTGGWGNLRDSDPYRANGVMIDPNLVYTDDASTHSVYQSGINGGTPYKEWSKTSDLAKKDSKGHDYVGRPYPLHNWMNLFRQMISDVYVLKGQLLVDGEGLYNVPLILTSKTDGNVYKTSTESQLKGLYWFNLPPKSDTYTISADGYHLDVSEITVNDWITEQPLVGIR